MLPKEKRLPFSSDSYATPNSSILLGLHLSSALRNTSTGPWFEALCWSKSAQMTPNSCDPFSCIASNTGMSHLIEYELVRLAGRRSFRIMADMCFREIPGCFLEFHLWNTTRAAWVLSDENSSGIRGAFIRVPLLSEEEENET